MEYKTIDKELGYYEFEIYYLSRVGYGDGKLSENIFELDYLFINEENRRNRYGSLLLKYIESEVKKLGAKKIIGEFIPQKGISTDNLRKFYKANNYKIISGYVEKDLI